MFDICKNSSKCVVFPQQHISSPVATEQLPHWTMWFYEELQESVSIEQSKVLAKKKSYKWLVILY